MKSTLHKKLTLLLGFETVCECIYACAHSTAWTLGIVWCGGITGLFTTALPKKVQNTFYMVSCICKAANWLKDDLKKLCGSTGSTQWGPWNMEHQLCAERQPTRYQQAQHLPPQEWTGLSGREEERWWISQTWGGSLQVLKNKSQVFLGVVGFPLMSKWESFFWSVFLASIFSSAKWGQKFLPYNILVLSGSDAWNMWNK